MDKAQKWAILVSNVVDESESHPKIETDKLSTDTRYLRTVTNSISFFTVHHCS